MEQIAESTLLCADRAASSTSVRHPGAIQLALELDLLLSGHRGELPRGARRVLRRLVEAGGAIVPEADLRRQLPPRGTGIRRCIAALNAAMSQGSSYVAEFPKRGYALIASASSPVGGARFGVPASHGRMFGVESVLTDLAERVRSNRLLTIAGPGGIGKTTMAIELTRRLAATFGAGMVFVDLAPIDSPALVQGALAMALGTTKAPDGAAAAVGSLANGRRMLVVVDNCEHLRPAAAELVQKVLEMSPFAQVLVTSREPLRLPGECVHVLAPLAVPPAGVASAEALLEHPAASLFVERAQAAACKLPRDSRDVEAIVDICRQLDGIPLAIELAAAQVGILGPEVLAQHLSRQTTWPTSGRRRVGPARHRTLDALLDWSYNLLTPVEQRVLARLSIFRSWFTHGAAGRVCADGDLDESATARVIARLVDKSLVAAGTGANRGQLRLLVATRGYAARKLDARDQDRISLRHLEYLMGLLDESVRTWETMSRMAWAAVYGPWVDDIRAAIDWAFATEGHERVGIELTLGACLFAQRSGLMFELEGRVARAADLLDRLQPPDRLLTARLLSALPTLIGWQRGDPMVSREEVAYHYSLEIARLTGDAGYVASPMLGLWLRALHLGDYSDALKWALKMEVHAGIDNHPLLWLARRSQAMALQFVGRLEEARVLSVRVREQGGSKLPFAYSPSSIDGAVSARVSLARSLWMGGQPDQAVQAAEEGRMLASREGPFVECYAMALGSTAVSLWSGKLAAVARDLERMRDLVLTYTLGYWKVWLAMYEICLELRGEDAVAPAPTHSMLSSLRPPTMTLCRDHAVTFDHRLAGIADLARAQRGNAGWCGPETLRARAMLSADPEVTTRLLAAAEEQSESQAALSWQLRIAISVANRRRWFGQRHAAAQALERIYNQFSEGFDTADMRDARTLLEALST